MNYWVEIVSPDKITFLSIILLVASIIAYTEAITMSSPVFRDETVWPSLSSILTTTSAVASDPPVIDSSRYSLIFTSSIWPTIFWIAFNAASTGPTPISEEITSLSPVLILTTAVGMMFIPVTI